MSKYILYENQTLLWKTLQSLPIFHQTISEENKTQWFKSIIEHFYQQYQNMELTPKDLRELNKATIAYCIQTLKSSSSSSTPLSSLSPDAKTSPDESFFNRQKEYEQMATREIPKAPDFSEPIDDKAIENIGELIKKHQLERDSIMNTQDEPALPQKNRNVSWTDDHVAQLQDKIVYLESTVENMNNKINSMYDDYNQVIIYNKMDSIIKSVETSL